MKRLMTCIALLFALPLFAASGIYPMDGWFSTNLAKSKSFGEVRTNIAAHDAANLTKGTIPDARLSANVQLHDSPLAVTNGNSDAEIGFNLDSGGYDFGGDLYAQSFHGLGTHLTGVGQLSQSNTWTGGSYHSGAVTFAGGVTMDGTTHMGDVVASSITGSGAGITDVASVSTAVSNWISGSIASSTSEGVSPVGYGATPDDDADDAVALQDWLNANTNCFLPGGRWISSLPLYAPNAGTRISGVRGASWIDFSTNATGVLLNLTNTSCVVQGIGLRGGATNYFTSLQLTRGTRGTRDALLFSPVGVGVCRDNIILGFSGVGIAVVGNGDISARLNHATIADNYITNCWTAIQLTNQDASEYVACVRNQVLNCWNGIDVGSANCIVTLNSICDVNFGFYVNPKVGTYDGRSHSQIIFNDSHHTQHPIYIRDSKTGLQVKGNSFLGGFYTVVSNTTLACIENNVWEVTGGLIEYASSTQTNVYFGNRFTANSATYVSGNGFLVTNSAWVGNWKFGEGFILPYDNREKSVSVSVHPQTSRGFGDALLSASQTWSGFQTFSNTTIAGITTNYAVSTGGMIETNFATGNWIRRTNGVLTLGTTNAQAAITIDGGAGSITASNSGYQQIQAKGTGGTAFIGHGGAVGAVGTTGNKSLYVMPNNTGTWEFKPGGGLVGIGSSSNSYFYTSSYGQFGALLVGQGHVNVRNAVGASSGDYTQYQATGYDPTDTNNTPHTVFLGAGGTGGTVGTMGDYGLYFKTRNLTKWWINPNGVLASYSATPEHTNQTADLWLQTPGARGYGKLMLGIGDTNTTGNAAIYFDGANLVIDPKHTNSTGGVCVNGSVTATNGFAIPTNITTGSVWAPIAGMIRFVTSNEVIYAVSERKTNVWLDMR